jgi:hypothetical protein
MKQETTLEEAAERIYPTTIDSFTDNYFDLSERERLIFINGAKWQEQRMYSEEDLKQFAWECVANFLSNNDNKVEIALTDVIINRNNKQFEKFKKK